MRLVALIAAALAAVPLASAQNDLISALGMYPVCGQKCTGAALPLTHCALTNSTCLCADMTLQNNVTACVLETCTVREALSVKNITQTACHAPIRDRSREHRVVNDVLGVISALFIIQRFAFKIFNKMGLFWDDWFALATIVSGAPSTVMNAYGLGPNGIGRDVWTLTGDQITNFGHFFFFIEVLYFFQVTSLKLSLLFFYLRIFPDKTVQKLLWGSVGIVVVFGVTFIFIGIFQCTPISFFWTKWDGLGQGHCLDTNIIGWTNASISIALDLWMLAIPLSQLRGLRMNMKKKIGVAAMLCVGTFVTVVSILRLQSLVEFRADTLNPTWDFFSVALWSDIEINVGIMCICMPSLRVLLTRLWPKVFGGSTNASYVNYSHHYNRSNRSGTAASKNKRPANASAVSAGFGGEDLPYDGTDDRYGGPIKMDHIVYNHNNTNNNHHDAPPQSRDGDEKSLAPRRSPQEW